MQQKNIKKALNRQNIRNVDGVVRRPVAKAKLKAPIKLKPTYLVPFKPETRAIPRFIFFQRLCKEKKVPVVVAVAALIVAFAAGSWSVLSTSKTAAEDSPQVLGAFTNQPVGQNSSGQGPLTGQSILSVSSEPVATSDSAKISNQILLSLTLDQLENIYQIL